ncbi:hypothetical protein [Microvirga pakistanensis]|uniref:hypothetical protein n=1 Tax=Microvirga pakistanensis TaxID=1682650 RepID=UPI0010694181|nr:hypothetical protein [Microvirga pakistanensis]
MAGDQPFSSIATRVAERVAEGLAIGNSLLREVEDVSFVAKGFHVVKDLNPAALGSVLATQGNGDPNDQGEIVGIATSAFPLLSSIRRNSRQPPARNKTPAKPRG